MTLAQQDTARRTAAIDHLRQRITEDLAVFLRPRLAKFERMVREDERERQRVAAEQGSEAKA